MLATKTSPKTKTSVFIDVALCIVLLIVALAIVLRATTPYPPPPLDQEIYQVRGQIHVSAVKQSDGKVLVAKKTIVLLRNGMDRGFRREIPKPLPSDVFFVKPGTDEKGEFLLVPVRPITEEQKQK